MRIPIAPTSRTMRIPDSPGWFKTRTAALIPASYRTWPGSTAGLGVATGEFDGLIAGQPVSIA